MNERKIVISLFLISVIVFISVSAFVIFSGNLVKVQYIGDDSFYYLNLAKHFVNDGSWSFDNFGTPATGFHLFNAYFISLIYFLFQNNLLIVLPLIYTLILLSFVALLVKTNKNENTLLIITLLLSSFATLINVVSFMEWIWVVIFSALLFYVYFYRKSHTTLFAVSLFGILARSDFVILLFAFAIVSFAIGKNKFTPAVFVIAIVTGVLIYTIHNYLISGVFLQSSASAKLHRSMLLGFSPFPFLLQVARGFIGFGRLHLFENAESRILFYHFALLLIVVISIFLFSSKKIKMNRLIHFINSFNKREKEVLIISILAVIFYSIFYSFNSFGMQIWYSSVVIIPIAILIYYFLKKTKTKIVTILIYLIILFNLSVSIFSQPFNKEQITALELTEAVKNSFEYNENTRFAAWDCGILGYFLNGQVINLDGLVNSEVIPFLENNELRKYLNDKKIDYLLQKPPEPAKFYGYKEDLKHKLISREIIYKNKKYTIYGIR